MDQFLTLKRANIGPVFNFTAFYSAFEHQAKFAQKRALQKNDNFSHFAEHGLIKKKFCCNPPLDQKIVLFSCLL